MKTSKKFYPWALAINGSIAKKFATLWGLGKFIAPGTWGSLAGIGFYLVLFDGLSFSRYVIFALLFAYLACGICHRAETFMQQKDPGEINLDEFVAMPFCFLPILSESFSGVYILLGFVLFRFFDITKKYGIDKFQSLEGGLGCVADDIVAALYTTVILNVLICIF